MARQKIGSTRVSSLLNSANSAMNSRLSYEDQIQAYNYQLSGKTQDDLNTYTDYLKGRANNTTDPAKSLAITKAQDSAWKGYKSAEIGRAQQAVDYGSGSLYDKRNTYDRLIAEAQGIGDTATAQNLTLSRSALDIQIQNMENQAAGGSSRGGGGSKYETQAGVNAEKTYTDMNTIKDHLGAQLATGKISHSQYLLDMEKVAQTTSDLSNRVAAEADARKNGQSTNDPYVSGLSENDLEAIQKKSDDYFKSADYKQFSPEVLNRSNKYGQQDFGVGYKNGVAESVARPLNTEFTNPDGSVGHSYKMGDLGNGSLWGNFKDNAGGPAIPTKLQTFDHDVSGAHTPYKTIMAPDGKGGFKPLIEMNVKAGNQDGADPNNPIMKTVWVDPSKPGATQFLQNWAANNNSWNQTGSDIATMAGESPIAQMLNPAPGMKLLGEAPIAAFKDNPLVKSGEGVFNSLKDAISGKSVQTGSPEHMDFLHSAASHILGGTEALNGIMGTSNQIGNWLGLNNLKQKSDALAMQAAAKANADATAQAAQRAQAVRAGEVAAIPAPAKPVPGKPAPYSPAPLAGQKGFVQPVDAVKATIANPASTARDALKSIIGF